MYYDFFQQKKGPVFTEPFLLLNCQLLNNLFYRTVIIDVEEDGTYK